MEVFAVPTPTYSGNCKPNLESFLVESLATRQKASTVWGERSQHARLSLKRDADLLAG